METKAEFAVKILKQYADKNQILPRSTSDLSNLESWLLVELYKTNLKNGSNVKLTDDDDVIEEKQLRYFVDVRSGCAAVRDREHEKYDPTYPGLHSDTSDIFEYRHGYIGEDSWNMKQEDIDYLNNLCDTLNNSLANNQCLKNLVMQH
jgi:hypothetical protein